MFEATGLEMLVYWLSNDFYLENLVVDVICGENIGRSYFHE